jgi:hypothetical protein
MKLAVLGTGVVGRALAGRLSQLDHEVTVDTDDPAAKETGRAAVPLPRFVTVMLLAVPAWDAGRAGAGRESGSDRNRPFGRQAGGCSRGAGAWRLALAARVAHS